MAFEDGRFGSGRLRRTERSDLPMILFVTRKFPPRVGGMETFSYHLARELARRVPVRLVAWPRSQKALPRFGFTVVGQFARLARAKTPISVVYFGDALSAFAAPLAARFFPKVPRVATAHGLDVTYPPVFYQWSIRQILGQLDRVICDSAAGAVECRERGVPIATCPIIPLGVDVRSPLSRTAEVQHEARRTLSEVIGPISLDDPLFLTVGRLVRRKGVAWFVSEVLPGVLNRHPTATYVIAGDGPEREHILTLARERGVGDRCRLLGQVEPSTRDLLYRAADLFVMPNISVPGDVEGFGLVALEANVAGLWVVAAAVDGVVEAVTGESGQLLPPRQAEPWCEQINSLLADRAHCLARGDVAQEQAIAHRGWDTVAERYLRVFEEVQPALASVGKREWVREGQ